MKRLDTLVITHGPEERAIELWHGDLANLPAEWDVDILVVSAHPNDYEPTEGSLIGALNTRGISVENLAHNKMVDLRQTCSCWMSQPVKIQQTDVPFKQILCFEPLHRGHPAEVVGDIFRSLVPFVCEYPPKTQVAMPVVSTGYLSISLEDMVEPLFNAAVNWLEHGLPVQTLKIVECSEPRALELKGAFAILKKQYERKLRQTGHKRNYDLFISYSHQNAADMSLVMEELKRINPNIRIFIDKKDLEPGVAWQQKLYEAIDDCYKVIALYTPEYASSKACQEEYNIARVLHRQTPQGVLMPIYLRSADLPPHMGEWQYIDCREADRERVREACRQIIYTLNSSTST